MYLKCYICNVTTYVFKVLCVFRTIVFICLNVYVFFIGYVVFI